MGDHSVQLIMGVTKSWPATGNNHNEESHYRLDVTVGAMRIST